ncbi:MAG: glycosyltransferase family A protein, partial [Candidatus Heimdallarchaeota archaeon]
GSTDKTSQIAKKAAEKAKLNFEIINRKDRGFAALGQATLARIYNESFSSVDLSKYDFLVINGADALLANDYFEKLLEKFNENPNLVIASGYCPGEKINKGHAHGIGRFYRMDFFIKTCKGRFEISNAWESIPIFLANVNGKTVKSYQEPILYHLRPRFARAADRIYILRGAAMKEVGYWTPYAIGRCILVSKKHKRIKVGILMLVGFYRARTSKRLEKLAKEYRKYQINFVTKTLLTKLRKLK